MLLATAAAALVLSGCGTGGSSSGGSGGPTSGASTPYLPASGTDQTGVLFQKYSNKSAGYSFLFPGGWRITEKPPTGVRIARFGNAITAVVTARATAPYYKGYQKTLDKQLGEHDAKKLSKIDGAVTQVKVGPTKKPNAVRAVIEQVRPTGTTTPPETIVVVRYLFWKSGKLLTLSMSSVKGIDNTLAYDLMANSFRW
jgi:hypothetical protein